MATAIIRAPIADEAYYEITKRMLDDEIFEGSVLDIYADLKNDAIDGIFDIDPVDVDITNILYLVNEEMEYLIGQFMTLSGSVEDEEEIARFTAKWEDEMFPILPHMIEQVLLKHNLPFVNTYELIGISTHSDNILECQNVLFPQFKEVLTSEQRFKKL